MIDSSRVRSREHSRVMGRCAVVFEDFFSLYMTPVSDTPCATSPPQTAHKPTKRQARSGDTLAHGMGARVELVHVARRARSLILQ